MASFIEKLRNQRRKERLAREMTHTPQQPIYNPVGDALVQWGRGVKERVSNPLETIANEATRWRTMPIEQKTEEMMGMMNPVGGMAGMITNKADEMAKLIKDVEDARVLYELQRAQRLQQMNQPSNALRNLAVGAGALGAGTASGYYGMGMVE